MSQVRRLGTHARRMLAGAGAAVVGAAAGALLLLGAEGLSMPAPETHTPQAGAEASASHPAALLAWAVGGVPGRTELAVERVDGVIDATTVQAGLDWMSRSRSPDGRVLDRPGNGRAIPLEIAIVEPREYAELVPVAERPLLLSLRPGEALVAESEARLRGAGAGLEMRLQDGWLRVAGVISDAAANGYEVLMRGPVPPSWGRADRFVLAIVERCAGRAIKARIEPLLDGRPLRVRCGREQPFLRYGDSVLPQLVLKRTFGEFAARPLPDGTLDVDPVWRNRNIVTVDVPLLPPVTCHRTIVPQLRGALRELLARGLSHTVDPAQYAGCYAPRFISRDPDGRLSHHAWGIAIDLNSSENSFGSKPNQDRRLVAVMDRWGFTWGGGWLVPDPMHFEWLRWP